MPEVRVLPEAVQRNPATSLLFRIGWEKVLPTYPVARKALLPDHSAQSRVDLDDQGRQESNGTQKDALRSLSGSTIVMFKNQSSTRMPEAVTQCVGMLIRMGRSATVPLPARTRSSDCSPTAQIVAEVRFMESFQGKTVLITGAAAGIGRSMALLLAEQRADLALVDRDMETLQKTQAHCQAKGSASKAYYCDIGSKVDIESMLEQVTADLGHVDTLINNAGTVVGKHAHEYEYDDLKQTMLVNFVGGAYLTRLVLPDMMERNVGQIVNMASVVGLVAMPRMGDYVASKSAVIAFTDTLRRELRKAGRTGVKTLSVCTTGVDTGLFPGYRAPRLVPLLQPESVARKVLKAVSKEKSHLEIPLLAKIIPAIKLLPTSLQDAILQATGFSSSMDGFSKRG